MAIWNLGSINIDHFYDLPHIPAPGETLAATGLSTGLGGKGANMSVAAARAGAVVHHIGARGADAPWVEARLMEYGVDTRFITTLPMATGHAIIARAAGGENAIIVFAGANHALPEQGLQAALSAAATGDWLLMQNETLLQAPAAALARTLGLRVAYAAAPFDAGAVRALLPDLDLLVLNEVEAKQLEQSLTRGIETLPVADILVTLGAAGCRHIAGGVVTDHPAVPVEAVDTTGAGDTFTGYVLAARDRGLSMAQAIRLASHAAALKVMRPGTADVIPDLREVEAAMRGQ